MIDGNLVVGGTGGNDIITVSTASPGGAVVNVSGKILTNPTRADGKWVLPATGHVIVNGGAGNDYISTPGPVSAEVHCGDGNNTVMGGAGNDVIWGGNGNNLLIDSVGRNVLIAGRGHSTVLGGSGADIVIGGGLDGGLDYAALRAMSDAWATSATVPTNLLSHVLAPLDLTAPDFLSGGGSADLFVARASNIDFLTDFVSAAGDRKLTF